MAPKKRSKSTMTYLCQRCGRHTFETRQSGNTKYCVECRVTVRKEQGKERAQRYRDRRAAEKAEASLEARWAALLGRAHYRPALAGS